jgi:N4-gp56 family major capsid protein
MALGTNQMTGTTHAVYRPNVWAKELLRARESKLVLVPLVKHYDRDVASFGQTVEIPNLSNLTANAKVANTQVTLNGPTETKQTLTINQHYEASFVVEDFADIQSMYDMAAEYTEKAGYAIAEKMDSTLAVAMAAGFTQTVGAFGTPLSDANILTGIQYLDDAKAPTDDRNFVVTPQGKRELLSIDKYIRYDALGIGGEANSIRSGQIGEIYGVKVWMSQNLVFVAGTPNQNNHLLFHKESAAIAIQKSVSTEHQRKTEYLGDLYVASALWGVKVIRVDHGVLVKS